MKAFMSLLGVIVVVVGIVAVVYLVSNNQNVTEHEVKIEVPQVDEPVMPAPDRQ